MLLSSDLREGVAGNAGRLLLSHLIRLGLGLVGSALIARSLGPERLGTYAIVGVAVMIAATIGDAGLTGSAVRRIAGLLTSSPAGARVTAAAYTRLRLVSGLLLCLVAVLFARPLAGLAGLPQVSGPALIRVGGVAVLVASASGAVSTILHAQHRFRALVLTQSGSSAVTVAVLILLFLLDRLTILTAIAAGVAGSAAAFAIALALLSPDWRRELPRGALWNDESRKLLAFGKWLWIAASLSILSAQLDLLMVHRWLRPEMVGIYALAFALALKADLVNQIFHTLLLPAASALAQRAEFVAFARRGFTRGLLLAVPLILLVPFARPFISVVYGAEYLPAAGVFSALVIIILLDLLTQPLLLLPFPMNLPRLIAGADAARVATLMVCGAVLIPQFGLYGAVGAKLAAKIVGAAVIGLPVCMRLRAAGPPHVPVPDAGSPRAAASPERM